MNKKVITAVVSLVCSLVPAASQSFSEGFFLGAYKNGYQFNPAIQNEGTVLSVGHWQNETRSDFGAGSFLYPTEDGVVTALHSSISAERFLGSLPKDNYTFSNINFGLFSYGWRNGEDYHTLEANIRGTFGYSVPREIFEILKLGGSEIIYDLSGMRLMGNVRVELACGYSHKVSDMLTVGVRPKLLIGIEALSYDFNRFDLTVGEEEYVASVEADFNLTSRWSKIIPDSDGYLSLKNLSAKEKWRMPSGVGLSADLGVLVTPAEGLTLSASLLDLGGMVWYYGNAGVSEGTTTFKGVEDLTIEEMKEGEIAENLKEVGKEFLDKLKIKAANQKARLESIPFAANAAVKYELPFYRELSVGATGNLSLFEGRKYGEGRLSVAWNPDTRYAVTANIGAGSFGAVCGFAFTASVNRFRISAGLEDGFGGKVPYTSWHIKPYSRVVTLGMTCDL